ncbi:T9SS type A sorting domain-containing protein [Cryomorpha ignava]|uniref:T9SS type A sorting domain-containing protein n=1 Tax=Cryomorpha ignava TaxID=101383 RepID=A0A7K3WR86_9FLAO|nr:choice-of-anchor L domain-containing protein [Cryomorpha ignava]NEN24036.1 T9SS type A sorting domain-containing protein [Cryomorpha ignava]
MKNLKKYMIVVVAVLTSALAFSQIAVVDETDATILANTLIGSESGVTIVSATFTGSANSSGTFSGGDFGIGEGILLTSGSAQLAVGPNTSSGSGTGNGTPGDADLNLITAPFTTNDAAILEITFIPSGNSLEFTYVFASEEYNEYVCSSFNDAFAFIVNGGAYTNQNIALLPGTTPPLPVSINNVNNGTVGSSGSSTNCTETQLANSAFYVDNADGLNIEYDGYTIPLAAVIAVVPGVEYTIKLAIADAGDSALDSGVFLEGESFVSVICDAGEIAFANSDDTTIEYCIDDLPSAINLSNTGDGINDTYEYIVTDSDGLILSIHASNSISTEGWTPGIYNIYGISYSGNLIGTGEGGNIENISADGCFEMDGPLTVDIDECEGEFDCPEIGANFGDPCDDGHPDTENDMISEDCSCMGTLIEYDCPELGLNIGDPCELEPAKGLTQKVMGIVGPGCGCVPIQPGPGCTNWRYYFADIANNGVTDIYEVTLNGGFADLNLIVVSNEEVHIALDETSSLLYLVRKTDGALSVVDISGPPPVMSPWQPLSMNIPGVVTATIAPNGKLVIGSESQDQIYSVNLLTFVVSSYDTYSPIYGGDLEFDSNGNLYLAANQALYLNNPHPVVDQFLATLNNTHKVTGLALTASDDLISSYLGLDQFLLHDVAGNLLGDYDIRLNGIPHVANYGDMTSGCLPSPPDEGICTLFSTFYVHHGPGVAGSDLYRVTFSGGDANLTFLTNVPFEAHIAYNAMNDIIYLVNKDGSFVRFYDPTFDVFLGDLPLVAGLTELTATVYNKVDGYLYVGSGNQNKVFQVNLITGANIFYANAPVSGGDLAIKNSELYLASRSGNTLYKFVAGVPVLLGNILNNVTGLVEANNIAGLITSNNGSYDFIEVDAANGNQITTYPAMLGGAPFLLLNGDMAAGCADNPTDVGECQEFDYYYIADNHPGIPQGNVYGGAVNGGDFVLTYLFNAGNRGHIAVSETNGNIYVVNNNGANIKTFSPAGVLTHTAALSGLNSTYALVWHEADGKLYVGNSSSDEVYTIDPVLGTKILFANNMPVNGGDLISTPIGELLLVKRDDNGPSKVYDITSGTAVFLYDVASAINGAALLQNGGSIMAEGANSLNFHTYDAAGVPGAVLNSVDNLGNPFPLFDGDMASGCMDGVVPVSPSPAAIQTQVESLLNSFPNPTIGESQVVFETAITGPTTLEVFDMNGKNIATLFNTVADQGQEYRIYFNGSSLPNGIYVYKLTTQNEVVISKFMIAR